MFSNAISCISNDLPMGVSGSKIKIGSEDELIDAQTFAESLAWELFEKNNFQDNFGNLGATLKDVAQNLLDKYPDLEIHGELVLDSEWSSTIEIVSTVDGKIESEVETL